MQRTVQSVMAATVAGLSLGLSFAATAGAAPAKPASAATASAAGEPAITTKGVAGDYLRAIHTRLHGAWTQDFIRTVAVTHPPEHPLNDPSRQVTIALTIRWDGTIAESSVLATSGSSEFDHDALDVAKKSAPFPLPPQDVISDDQYAHVEWTFARDHRACGAGARVARVEDPIEISLPRLVRFDRIGEALRRVGETPRNSENAALDQFARVYLTRTVPDPILNTAAALALASAGDRAQIPRLRGALASRATLEMAARGLQKLGVDVCEAVHDPMVGTVGFARDMAFDAVRTLAVGGADIAGCRPALTTIISDAHQPSNVRVAALDMLVTYLPAQARPVVIEATQDKDMSLRGAALLHSVRRGAGRPEMYRLAPMLHDKAVEIRGAASAGMVRAAGDLALDQLYLLGRETDPRPAQLVAAELGQQSTPATAELLGKLLKRNSVPIQVAAARALAARKDAPARTELMAIDPNSSSEALAIAASVTKQSMPPATEADGTPAVAAPAEATPVSRLLKENHTHEALLWIVDKLPTLPAGDAISVLGAWLSRGATASAEGAEPAGAPASTPHVESSSPAPAAAANTSALAL